VETPVTITNGYCTLAELKEILRILDTVDDELLEARINEASRVIDTHCNRRFYADATASARLFTSIDGSTIFVDDISSTSGLVVKSDAAGDGTYATTIAAADFQAEPLNAIVKGNPITSIASRISGAFSMAAVPAGCQVTAKWGWPAVPDPVHSACLILAGRLVKRGDSLLGVAGFGELGAITVRAIDPDVERMLRPYRIHVVA
jgi:hypothetical protein